MPIALLALDAPEDRDALSLALSTALPELVTRPLRDLGALRAALETLAPDLLVVSSRFDGADDAEVIAVARARAAVCVVITVAPLDARLRGGGRNDCVPRDGNWIEVVARSAARLLSAPLDAESEPVDALDAVPFPIGRSASDGTLLSANRALRALLEIPEGVPSARFSARAFYVSPAERLKIVDALRRDVTQDIEAHLLTWGGRATWAEFLSMRRADPSVFEFAVRDVGRRKLAEEALARSEARYRSLIEAQADIVCRSLPDGTITYVNPATERFMRMSSDAMLGRNWFDMVGDAKVAAELRAAIARLSPENPALSYENPTRVGGEARWHLWSNRAIFDCAGRMVEVQAVARDITERKVAEERLKRALDERETLLREVLHRVKNNLQLLSSLLNAHLRDRGDPALAALLAGLQRRIHAMALVHEHLYGLSDLDAVDMDRYVRGLLRALLLAHGDIASRVTVDLDVGSASLPLDLAMRIGMILGELASNALRHAFPASRQGTLAVRLQHGRGVVLEVRDDGVGLDASFDIAHSPSLGLRLVSELVSHLHGTLTVRRNGGTHYRIELPEVG